MQMLSCLCRHCRANRRYRTPQTVVNCAAIFIRAKVI